jgi:hypothetical protein
VVQKAQAMPIFVLYVLQLKSQKSLFFISLLEAENVPPNFEFFPLGYCAVLQLHSSTGTLSLL